MGGTGRGVRQRDGATEEMGEERHERMGAHGPSCEMSYSSWRGDHRMCWEDSRLGCSLLQGKEGKGSGETTPPRSSPPTLWKGGSSYHWQGAWGGGCQSPRLPDWNWSYHLICCVGREANGAVSKGVGVKVGESCSLTCCPAPKILQPHW